MPWQARHASHSDRSGGLRESVRDRTCLICGQLVDEFHASVWRGFVCTFSV